MLRDRKPKTRYLFENKKTVGYILMSLTAGLRLRATGSIFSAAAVRYVLPGNDGKTSESARSERQYFLTDTV